MKKIIALITGLLLLFTLSSCTQPEAPELTTDGEELTSSAEDATASLPAAYEEDATIGEGEAAVTLKVITDEKTYTFTILTDKTNLGEALKESGIVEGEDGPYGLYIKKVNGICAVYEEDNTYWSLSVNGEAAVTGADGITINSADTYELTKVKA